MGAPPVQLEVGLLKRDVRPLQLRLARLEVPGHAVEGVAAATDLIVRLDGDPEVQSARRDGLGAFRQLLDGHGDPLGDLEPEPCSRENDHQRDAHDQRDVLRLDGILVGHGFFEVFLGWGAPSIFATRAFRRDVVTAYTPAPWGEVLADWIGTAAPS